MEPLKQKPKIIIFICPSCQAELELEGTAEDWAGHVIQCPACEVETPFPEPVDMSGLDIPTEPETPQQQGHVCPSCSVELPEKAVFCVNCGFNLRTKERVETFTGEKKKEKKKSSSGLQLASIDEETYCGMCGSRVFYGGNLCRPCQQKEAATKKAQENGEEPDRKLESTIALKKKPKCESCGGEIDSPLAICGMCGHNPLSNK